MGGDWSSTGGQYQGTDAMETSDPNFHKEKAML